VQRYKVWKYSPNFFAFSENIANFAPIKENASCSVYKMPIWQKIFLKTMTNTLDETDLQILRTLQKNAKLTTKELADAVHLTPTPVFERQKRLERKGYIKKYIAVLDPEKLNYGLLVFCKVKLKQINHEIADAFTRRIARIPEVTECYNTSGAYDYLLKVRATDMKQYQEFVLNKLGDIEYLSSIESTFVMSEVKQSYGINI
jgi:Lrp/AsnC family leucine-responsive transcriptional regulator